MREGERFAHSAGSSIATTTINATHCLRAEVAGGLLPIAATVRVCQSAGGAG